MNISHQSIIRKIEQELMSAKTEVQSDKMKEHIYSIKALCEVLLESESTHLSTSAPSGNVQQQPSYIPPSQPAQPIRIQEEKKLKTDDGANGDSIFDF
ncbi:YwdI family protein [Rossellomorea sp. BNER]|jgi:hypothetical protein|uniref:YwdI family protein n=1 Tax=Rossellomorea sp. BNER TaxID=2962031 RepID=UPI003AF24E1E|nr:YwdI family protein [Rossellomorea sp. BNER]